MKHLERVLNQLLIERLKSRKACKILVKMRAGKITYIFIEETVFID